MAEMGGFFGFLIIILGIGLAVLIIVMLIRQFGMYSDIAKITKQLAEIIELKKSGGLN